MRTSQLLIAVVAMVVVYLVLVRGDNYSCDKDLTFENTLDENPLEMYSVSATAGEHILKALTPYVTENGQDLDFGTQVVYKGTGNVWRVYVQVLHSIFDLKCPSIYRIAAAEVTKAAVLTMPKSATSVLAWVPADNVTAETEICYRSYAGKGPNPKQDAEFVPVMNRPVGFLELDNRGNLHVSSTKPATDRAAAWLDNAPMYPTLPSSGQVNLALPQMSDIVGPICVDESILDVCLNGQNSLLGRRLPPLGFAPTNSLIVADFEPFTGVLASHVTISSKEHAGGHLRCGEALTTKSGEEAYACLLVSNNVEEVAEYIQQEYYPAVETSDSTALCAVRICLTDYESGVKLVLCYVEPE